MRSPPSQKLRRTRQRRSCARRKEKGRLRKEPQQRFFQIRRKARLFVKALNLNLKQSRK